MSTHEGTKESKMFKENKDGKRHYKNTNWHKTMDKNVSMNTSKKILGVGATGGLNTSKSAKFVGNNSVSKSKRVNDGAVLNDVPKKGE